MHLSKTLAIIALLPVHLFAQSPSLDPVNEAFAGNVTFKIDKQQRLVADFIADGNRFRQDIAPLAELDPDAVSFSPEEDAVVLKCLAEKKQCFSKEIFKLDVVRLSGRSTLPRPIDDAGGERTIAILQELIRSSRTELVQAQDETPRDNHRKSKR